MRKATIVFIMLLTAFSFNSCGKSYSESDINDYLEGIETYRYVEVLVEISSNYDADDSQGSDFLDSNTNYTLSIDNQDVYMSVIYGDFPENGLTTTHTVIQKNNNDFITTYSLDEDYVIVNEFNSNIPEDINNSDLMNGITRDFLPDLAVLNEDDLSQLTSSSYSFNTNYEVVLENYPYLLSQMYRYSTMAASFYAGARYIFNYRFDEIGLTVEVEAILETDLLNQEVVATYTIWYPKSIEKVSKTTSAT